MVELADSISVSEPRRVTARAAAAATWRQRVAAWPVSTQFFFLLLGLYVIKQLIFVVLFPPFSGHDEVAHFSYMRTVATEYRVPEILDLEEFRLAWEADRRLAGDFIPDDLFQYCRYVLDWSYCNESAWRRNPPHVVTVGGEYYPYGWQYAANHPPLYYLAMAPLYRITDGLSAEAQQYLFRAASIPFGMLTVLLAFLLARTLFPGDRFLAVTVPAFVAFQPQISYEAAMVNNDIVGIAIYSLLLYLLVLGIRDRFPWRLTVAIGFVLGLGLLTKSTTLTVAPIVAVAMILGIGPLRLRAWLPRGVAAAVIAVVTAAPWYVYLYRTYGNFDGLDQVAANQWAHTYRSRDKPSILDQLWNRDFAELRWKETWGEFGWRLIHLDNNLLWAIGIPCLIAVAGLLAYAVLAVATWRGRGPAEERRDPVVAIARWQAVALLTLLLAFVVAYAGMLQFGTRFQLTQARYFFPAIVAISLLLMLGLRTVLPARGRRYGQAAVVVSLVVLNLVIYTQYVLPYWYLGT